MWEMAWVGPALLMSRTPSSIRGGCDPARSTTGHTHNIARAFYEDFSDLALFAEGEPAFPRQEGDTEGCELLRERGHVEDRCRRDGHLVLQISHSVRFNGLRPWPSKPAT